VRNAEKKAAAPNPKIVPLCVCPRQWDGKELRRQLPILPPMFGGRDDCFAGSCMRSSQRGAPVQAFSMQ